MKVVELRRFAYTEQGTFGKLSIRDGENEFYCYTIEREWKDNLVSKSCIPEGWYLLRKRFSPIVGRITKNEFIEGWEVTEVIGRTFIMIHPGNHQLHFEGCIGVGDSLGVVSNKWAIMNSMNTFRDLMELLNTEKEWLIKISFDKGV